MLGAMPQFQFRHARQLAYTLTVAVSGGAARTPSNSAPLILRSVGRALTEAGLFPRFSDGVSDRLGRRVRLLENYTISGSTFAATDADSAVSTPLAPA